MRPEPRFIVLLGLAWAAFVVLASLAYRRVRHKYIIHLHSAAPLYEESWASGRSLRNLLNRLSRSNKCLWITVGDDSLHVGHHIPYTLFSSDFYDLEYSIPAEDIVSVEKVERRFGKPAIRVTFRRDVPEEETFEILSKRPDELLAALDSIRTKRTRS